MTWIDTSAAGCLAAGARCTEALAREALPATHFCVCDSSELLHLIALSFLADACACCSLANLVDATARVVGAVDFYYRVVCKD